MVSLEFDGEDKVKEYCFFNVLNECEKNVIEIRKKQQKIDK